MTDTRYPPLTPEQLAEIAPTKTLRGKVVPNIYDQLPSRFITRDEAEARGWTLYFVGDSCRFGHVAPRYVTNSDLCVDCVRIRKGKPPIGSKARHQSFHKEHKPADGTATASAALALPVSTPKPDATDQRFLDAYALHRDIEKAAAAVGSTAALITARRSHNSVLDAAMTRLETELAIPRLVPESAPFTWTPENEARLFKEFINSGSIAVARDAIKCTAFDFFTHLEQSPAFANEYDRVRPLAIQAFEERGQQMALAGNDKILPLILKAEKPQKYGERVKIDLNDNRRLNDDQLTMRLLNTLNDALAIGIFRMNHRGQVIDAEFSKPAALPAPEPKQNGDLR